MQTVQCLICGKEIEAKTKAALSMKLHAHMRMHLIMEEWRKKHGLKNPVLPTTNPLKQFCCQICGTCAPKKLLYHGQFEDRMSWLRNHYKSEHPAAFRQMYENPFPVKTQSTRTIKGNKYWYAGRSQYFSKAQLELRILLEQGIGGAITQKEGWYLLWTRKPVWVDLSEPLY